MNVFMTRTRHNGYVLQTETQHKRGIDPFSYDAVIESVDSFCARDIHRLTGFLLRVGETKKVRIHIEEVTARVQPPAEEG